MKGERVRMRHREDERIGIWSVRMRTRPQRKQKEKGSHGERVKHAGGKIAVAGVKQVHRTGKTSRRIGREVVELRVKFPEGVGWKDDKEARKAIQVEARATSLTVRETGQGGQVLFEANPLFSKILADETSWYIEDGAVVIVLQKAEELYWPSIHPEDEPQDDSLKKSLTRSGPQIGEGGGVDGEDGRGDGLTGLSERAKVSRLLQAAKSGDLAALQAAAEAMDDGGEGLAVVLRETKDGNGRGALHFAAQEGRLEVCHYLTEEIGMDIDGRDEEGETALIHAAREGHVEVCEWLLEHGADACARSTKSGAGAIHHAASGGHDRLIKALVARGESANAPSEAGPPLIWAAERGVIASLRALLELGATVDATNSQLCSAVLVATAAGHLEAVRFLIDHGADVTIKALQGATCLHVAADRGDREMVDTLLSAGADPDAVDESGSKPIHVAAANRDEPIVEALLSNTSRDPDVVPWTVEEVIKKQNMLTDLSENAGDNEKTSMGKEGGRGGGGGGGELHQQQQRQQLPPPPPPRRIDMDENDPRVKQSLEAKARGDIAFKKADYMSAIDAYTQSLDLIDYNAAVLSNRSLCWIRVGQAERALEDAQAARAARPDWPKACYREGAALRLLGRLDEACTAFYEGVQLDPENKELVTAFRETMEHAKRQHSLPAPSS
ncbi:hypothetical protein CBR_g50831 [Chara braunii]|uniref:CS domain-containing protein n=1 Tax=Chara braunii TaxID=69332 RepID=A0A388M7J9_CHABU|nr:hypothetical protein CBR_g50831 [Chara braunii]|eukprot:GBG90485.1 hypothetical protein CBR_g50831 [Chara braunii]